MNISDFKAQFNDFIRPAHFEMTIAPPSFLSSTNTRFLTFLCNEVSTPNWTLNVTQEEVASIVWKKALRADFDNISVQYYIDDAMESYNFFFEWISQIHNTDTGSAKYYDDYVSPDISISILNNKKQAVAEFKLIEAWPSMLGPLPLSWQSTDSILIGAVDFTFRKFEFKLGSSDDKSKRKKPKNYAQNLATLQAGAAAYGFHLGD